jgi:hypothetical protein
MRKSDVDIIYYVRNLAPRRREKMVCEENDG